MNKKSFLKKIAFSYIICLTNSRFDQQKKATAINNLLSVIPRAYLAILYSDRIIPERRQFRMKLFYLFIYFSAILATTNFQKISRSVAIYFSVIKFTSIFRFSTRLKRHCCGNRFGWKKITRVLLIEISSLIKIALFDIDCPIKCAPIPYSSIRIGRWFVPLKCFQPCTHSFSCKCCCFLSHYYPNAHTPVRTG